MMLMLALVFGLPYSDALMAVKPYNTQSLRYTSQSTIFGGGCTVRNAIPTVSNNEELIPGIAAINKCNDELNEHLTRLCSHPYFRLFSVDILASCEYIPQELFECYTETCEIYPEDEEVVRYHLISTSTTIFQSVSL